MCALVNDAARRLSILAILLLAGGCAATSAPRVARAGAEVDCPMGFTLACEARQPGAAAGNCRCIRHRDIEGFLERY